MFLEMGNFFILVYVFGLSLGLLFNFFLYGCRVMTFIFSPEIMVKLNEKGKGTTQDAY